MPNGRALAIDAKTNIEAYLDAIEASDPDEAQRQLDRFARHVAEQAEALAKKDYWSSIDGCFDFVVMFVPGDQFIDAALERRPQLLDLAAQRGVILASPSTLIGLLRAVYLGWREKSLSDSARELFELGKELHERAATALGYAAEVGKAISRSQELYNRFVGSVDARLMPTLRRFEERGAASARELPQLSAVEGVTREMQSLPSVSTIPLGAPGRHEKAENGSAALRSSDSGVSDQPD
jgi:DNA recombination protein RmuC